MTKDGRRTLPTKKEVKICIFVLKYMPILMAVLNFMHVFCMMLDIRLTWVEYFTHMDIIPCLILLIVSKVHRFCFVHQLFSLYAMLTSYGITHRSEMPADVVQWLVVVFFVVGVLLFVQLGIHWKRYNEDCC